MDDRPQGLVVQLVHEVLHLFLTQQVSGHLQSLKAILEERSGLRAAISRGLTGGGGCLCLHNLSDSVAAFQDAHRVTHVATRKGVQDLEGSHCYLLESAPLEVGSGSP